MAIPLFGVMAQGGKILSLDDQAVVKDLAALNGTGGSTYVPTMRTVPFGAAQYNRLRRLVQALPHDGALTVTFTPWRDDQDTGQTITRTLAIGEANTVTVPFAVTGSTFQIELEVTSFGAAAEIGSGEVTLIPRRTQR